MVADSGMWKYEEAYVGLYVVPSLFVLIGHPLRCLSGLGLRVDTKIYMLW
jgi:hypothetical protein